jgi:hypothetical protein
MSMSGLASRIVKGPYAQTRPVYGGQWTNVASWESASGVETVTVRTALGPFNQVFQGADVLLGIPKVLIRITSGVPGARTISYTMAGTPKTVSGSNVYVQAQIFYDELGTILAPGSVSTNVTTTFSEGHGQDNQPTTWARSNFGSGIIVGSFQTLFIGPGALKQINGYNYSSSPTFLMLWDWPVPGQTPVTPPGAPPPGGNNPGQPLHVIPIPGAPASPGVAPYFSLDSIESKISFSYGFAFSCSSTGNEYTYDDTGEVYVAAEFYRGDEYAV